MAIVFEEFLNASEGRNYPLSDVATRLATNGQQLPNSLLADANIWLPRSAGRFVYVSSAAVTGSLVTLTFAACDASPVCGSVPSSFVPLAVLSLKKPVERFKNYAITPFLPGVGGWVMLGRAALDDSLFSLLFNSPDASFLLDRCVRAYREIPVKTLGKLGVSPPIDGVIQLTGSSGGITTKGGIRTINGQPTLVGLIGLDLGDSKVNRLLQFVGDCGHRPSSNNCNKPPITSINDVGPDCDGNIEIVFEGPVIVGDAVDGIVLDGTVGLAAACPANPFAKLIEETEDVCDPVTPPSSSSVSSSSLSSSSSSATPPPPPFVIGGSYCETFTDGIAQELTVIKGEYAFVEVNYFYPTFATGKRYRSAAGYPQAEQISLDYARRMSAVTGYDVSANIRMLDNSCGHLIFGYTNINNFFAVGVIQSHPSYPFGAFYIVQRVANEDLGGGELGLGNPGSRYAFLPGAVFPITNPADALPQVDYLVEANIVKMGGFVIVTLHATWIDTAGAPHVMNQSYPIPVGTIWKPANDVAYCGLGVFDSITEFDNYGINCTAIASSTIPSCNECSDFELGLGNIVVKQGSLSRVFVFGSYRLVSGSGGGMAIDSACIMDLYAPLKKYSVTSTVRPPTTGSAGLLISIGDGVFPSGGGNKWVVGITRDAEPGEPYGKFFILQTYDGGAASSIAFTPAFKALPSGIDFQLEAIVERIVGGDGSLVQITFNISWPDGGTQMSQVVKQVALGDGIAIDTIQVVTQGGLFADQSGASFDTFCVYNS